MKATFFTLLPLAGLFISAFAAPAPLAASVEVVEKRQTSEAYSIVSSLFTEVHEYTGAINTTSASLDSSSTKKEKKQAAVSYRTNIKAITAAVKAAKKQVKALETSDVEKRQTSAALAALVAGLIEDISGALNNIIATLGLTSLLGSLNPLVSSLSGLLLSLDAVVDNLLALVKQIVDGLLIGLSVGLAGLNL